MQVAFGFCAFEKLRDVVGHRKREPRIEIGANKRALLALITASAA
jgi:hypothetical protein